MVYDRDDERTSEGLVIPNQAQKSASSRFRLILGAEKVKGLVEVAGKFTIGLLGSFYVIGLFVVNLHLNKYGVYSLSLFRLNYITAGFWATFPLALSLTLFVVFSMSGFFFTEYISSLSNRPTTLWNPLGTEDFTDRDTTDRVISLICLAATILFTYFIPKLFLSLLFSNFPPEILKSWRFAVVLMTLGLTLIFLSRVTMNQSLRLYLLGPLSLSFAIGFIGYLIGFTTAYEGIPSYLGGGSSKTVQFLIDVDPKMKKMLRDSGITFQKEDEPEAKDNNGEKRVEVSPASSGEDYKEHVERTDDVQLIFNTEEEYLIQGSLGGVSIPHGVVRAVLYKREQHK